MHLQGLPLCLSIAAIYTIIKLHVAAQVHVGTTYFTEHKIVLGEISIN